MYGDMDKVIIEVLEEIKEKRKVKVKPTQEELVDIPIKVRAVKDGDRYLIDHKQLKKGLVYRTGIVFIHGIFIPITKLRQWLIPALKDPSTGRMIKDFDREDWATIWHVEKVRLANKTYDEGASLIITLPDMGGMKTRTTFVSDLRWHRYAHQVVFEVEDEDADV